MAIDMQDEENLPLDRPSYAGETAEARRIFMLLFFHDQ